MKILVATSETQGTRKNDFCFAPELEIVRFPLDHPGEDIDGSCGCRRAMEGIGSKKGSTTVKVFETLMIREKYRELIIGSLTVFLKDGADANRLGTLMADRLLMAAAEFSVGQILERRGEEFFVREDEWAEIIEL